MTAANTIVTPSKSSRLTLRASKTEKITAAVTTLSEMPPATPHQTHFTPSRRSVLDRYDMSRPVTITASMHSLSPMEAPARKEPLMSVSKTAMGL